MLATTFRFWSIVPAGRLGHHLLRRAWAAAGGNSNRRGLAGRYGLGSRRGLGSSCATGVGLAAGSRSRRATAATAGCGAAGAVVTAVAGVGAAAEVGGTATAGAGADATGAAGAWAVSVLERLVAKINIPISAMVSTTDGMCSCTDALLSHSISIACSNISGVERLMHGSTPPEPTRTPKNRRHMPSTQTAVRISYASISD